MDKRHYNIFYHLHTVAGIVLSILLFVIFFAGSFSFFRSEIINWERNDLVTTESGFDTPINEIVASIGDTMNLYGRDLNISRKRSESSIVFNISRSKDTTLTDVERAGSFFYVFTDDNTSQSYEDSYSLGEFIYRLHFLSQFGIYARYVAGFASLFLMFIVFTGTLVHWKKIILNFYVFRSKDKLKVLWKDLHTVLSTIGIPFQFIYGLTGAYFLIKIVLLVPAVTLLFGGKQEQLINDLGFPEPTHELSYKKMNKKVNFDSLIHVTNNRWKEFKVDHLHIYNYGDSSMAFSADGQLSYETKLISSGGIDYNLATDEAETAHSPYDENTYALSTIRMMTLMHYANYAGLGVKIASFLLGLACCFVVISGIMIWLDARVKKKISEKRKKFNAWVGHIYLATCLSMYPITATAFIFTRWLPTSYHADKMDFLYLLYFIGWAVISILLSIKKDNFFTNKFILVSGGLLGLFIPISDLILNNFNPFTHSDFILINTLWLALGLITLIIGLRSSNKNKELA